MNSSDRDFKGVWIPKEIWNIDTTHFRLSITEKCYLAMIKNGFSEKQADYWMKKAGVISVHRIKNELYLKDLYIPDNKKVNITSPEEAKNFVINHSNDGEICEWCGNKCYILHEHHYPISKKNGGTETVRICPNCHITYHSIFKEINNEQ